MNYVSGFRNGIRKSLNFAHHTPHRNIQNIIQYIYPIIKGEWITQSVFAKTWIAQSVKISLVLCIYQFHCSQLYHQQPLWWLLWRAFQPLRIPQDTRRSKPASMHPKNWVVKDKFAYKYPISNKERILFECKFPFCKWRLHCLIGLARVYLYLTAVLGWILCSSMIPHLPQLIESSSIGMVSAQPTVAYENSRATTSTTSFSLLPYYVLWLASIFSTVHLLPLRSMNRVWREIGKAWSLRLLKKALLSRESGSADADSGTGGSKYAASERYGERIGNIIEDDLHCGCNQREGYVNPKEQEVSPPQHEVGRLCREITWL